MERATRRRSRRTLAAEASRHERSRVAPAWRDDLAALGSGEPLDLTTVDGLRLGLELAACLLKLPPIPVLGPPPGAASGSERAGQAGDPRMLAKVRALLAKAESSDFPEEAELLSAKAQELISRHPLDRLLAETPEHSPGERPVARRIWVDPPYVMAKAMLVSAVAEANGCRVVISEHLGFCTVIGMESDLVAVDILVTSLLVQAAAAVARCGRHTDGRGMSRTRSFRQSFLVAYAARIGERLRAAADDAVTNSGRSTDLMPVLARRLEQVDAVQAELFPRVVARSTSVGNAEGWAAGRAAADFASLDVNSAITRAAG